jgi:hypothetical protein
MIGIIDESAPIQKDGQVIYTLSLVVTSSQSVETLQTYLISTLNRKNPFHWAEEGIETKRKFITSLASKNLRIHVFSAITNKSTQEYARAELFRERLLPSANFDGVGELIIEQRSPRQNSFDRATIKNWYRTHKFKMPEINHVNKDNPLTWLADATSGVWSDVLMGRSDRSFETMASNRQLIHVWWQQN